MVGNQFKNIKIIIISICKILKHNQTAIRSIPINPPDWRSQYLQYNPPNASKSLCVPCSAIFPSCNSIILSIFTIVDRRVLLQLQFFSLHNLMRLNLGLSLISRAMASSSISIGAFLRIALQELFAVFDHQRV